jgi:hypothetical protein
VAIAKIQGDYVSQVKSIRMKRYHSLFIYPTLILSCLLILLQEAPGQVKVTRISSQESITGKKGIVYTLQRSVVDVEIVVLKSQQIPGPLAEYAREFLGTSDVIVKNQTDYTIDHATLKVSNEPDPGQVYFIEREEKAQGEVWIGFGQGRKTVIIENFSKETSPKGFESWENDAFEQIDEDRVYSRYSSSAVREVIDTIIRKVSIDTLVIEDKVLKRSMVEYPDRDKAQEAIDQIRRIEGDMYNLLIGYQETPYSREALEFMYARLQAERQDFLSLFTGVTLTESVAFHFLVTPDPTAESNVYTVAGFSPTAGLIEAAEDNAISIAFIPDKMWTSLSDASIGETSKGIVYRTPVNVPVKLEYKGKVLASGNFEILQFGSLLSLPPEFKKVEIDLESGTIRSVVME